jgi:hypothetical protein
MRVKSKWHKTDKPKTPQQVASVIAFIIWRVTEETVTHIQKDKFEIASQQQAFDMIGEFLAFFVQLTDRVAYLRLGGELRAPVVQAVAKRLGEILEDNQLARLGSPGEESYPARFVKLLNERLTDYATFDYAEEPDFPTLRYLGNRIMDLMGKGDQSWIIDQIIEIEAPEAIKNVLKGLRDTLVADSIAI